MNNVVIGIDLGGTFIKAGAVSETGEILSRKKIPTRKERGYNEIASDICALSRSLAEGAGLDFSRIAAIGVGSPGIIDSEAGAVLSNCNLGWENVPLAAMLKEGTGIPAYVLNDANAAALGESRWGAGGGFSSLVLVTLGTGIGSGIVLNGKTVEGFHGAGAELGHTVIRKGGRPCACGRRGCFETYASATALVRETERAMRGDKASLMWRIAGNLKGVNGETAFKAAKLGDKSAQSVIDGYTDDLSEGLADVANLLRPEAILLGGGVAAAGDLLFTPLKRKLLQKAYGGERFAPLALLPAALGNDAGLCGAACFALDKSFKNERRKLCD